MQKVENYRIISHIIYRSMLSIQQIYKIEIWKNMFASFYNDSIIYFYNITPTVPKLLLNEHID